MKTKVHIRHIAVISILMTVGSALNSNAEVVSWNASSGLTPDQSGFQLYNTSNPETPIFNNSILTISNDSSSEQMRYGNIAPSVELQFPTVFEAAFRMKYVSGSSFYTGRTGAGVQATVAPYLDSTLWIGQDIIFLGGTPESRGPAITVDTDSAFHDYLFRIAGNTVSVFQDGALVLSGNTIFRPTEENYSNPKVTFGELSAVASGTSEWESFSHNAAVPEPMSAALILLMPPLMIIRRIFRVS